MALRNLAFFRELLEKNVAGLQDYCKNWGKIIEDDSIPEEVSDEIRTTIGLANLLINQKLNQFRGLIDDSEFKRGEKEITCLDLQGFWDMVYNEVEKIQKSFQNLEKCRRNDWVFVEESAVVKTESKKKPLPSNISKSNASSKSLALAARQRLAEAKLKMRAQMVDRKKAVQGGSNKNISTGVVIAVSANGSEEEAKQGSLKKTISHIQNIQLSSPRKRSMAKTAHKSSDELKSTLDEKENLPSVSVKSKLDKRQTPSKRSKESVPLQCLTRSAKKKLLESQNVKN